MTQNIRVLFDTPRFWGDVDRVRRARRFSWLRVRSLLGTSLGKRCNNPRIDTLLPVAVWAGLSLEAYVQIFDGEGATLSPSDAFARASVQSAEAVAAQQGKQDYDVARFYADLDQVRAQRKLAWRQVWRALPIQSCVPVSIGTHVRQKRRVSKRAARLLAQWAGLDFSAYLFEEAVDATTA